MASTESAPSSPALLTRAEAQARGLKRYFTGVPCPYGHVAEQHLSGHCVACLAERSRAGYVRRLATHATTAHR